jgi:uncharacterized protein
MSGRNRDAFVELKISDDELSASARFYPPLGSGHALDLEELKSQLAAAGIVHGLLEEALQKAVHRIAAERQPFFMEIARGTPQDDADPAYLKLAKRFFIQRLYGIEKGGRVDYREARPFIVVAKDDALGRFIPDSSGSEGTNVRGGIIPPGLKQRIAFEPGENTYRDGEFIRASIPGRFNLQGTRFYISEVLELSGVDFHTGHIRYPGDVVLRGEVGDGFKIVCGGDLHAAVPLDVTDIRVKGNVSVEGGILGRKPGVLKCGGAVTAKFVENLDLEARGPVRLEGSVLQSSIHTLAHLTCGEKGRIIHSRVYAVEGVEAQQLGNPAGAPTYISSGSDFRQVRRLKEIRLRRCSLKLKQDTLGGLAREGMLGREALSRQSKLLNEAQAALEELSEAEDEALRLIEKLPEARIVARDTVYPGVVLEICQVSRRISETVPRGSFYLNQEERRIKLIDS